MAKQARTFTPRRSNRISEDLFSPISTPRVREETIKQFEELMASGRLSPGDMLPAERRVSQRLGVSRTAVREALAALEKIGLISTADSGHRYVVGPHPEDTREWFVTSLVKHLESSRNVAFEWIEVRRIIEPETARLAAARSKDAQTLLTEMAAVLREQDELVKRGEAPVEQDIRFHNLIARASQNSVLERIVEVMNQAMYEWKQRTLELGDRIEASTADHWQLWKAISAGQPELAYEHALRHIETSQELVLRYLSLTRT